MADLVRAAQLKSELEFIGLSSYQDGTKSSGVVQITRDLQSDITNRDIMSSRIFSTPAIPSPS